MAEVTNKRTPAEKDLVSKKVVNILLMTCYKNIDLNISRFINDAALDFNSFEYYNLVEIAKWKSIYASRNPKLINSELTKIILEKPNNAFEQIKEKDRIILEILNEPNDYETRSGKRKTTDLFGYSITGLSNTFKLVFAAVSFVLIFGLFVFLFKSLKKETIKTPKKNKKN